MKGHERFRFCSGCVAGVLVLVGFDCQSPEGRSSGSGEVSGVSILRWAMLGVASLLLPVLLPLPFFLPPQSKKPGDNGLSFPRKN